MKLYLSSYRIPVPQALFDLVGKPAGQIRVAVIPNAKDYYAPLAWEYKVGDYVSYLSGLGLVPEVVDLRSFEDAGTLGRRLRGFGLVWVMGGNTFCLRYEMRRSGFEAAIGGLLEDGLVYAGDSAGAIAAGTDLKGVEYADEPHFAPEAIWEGLGLVPFAVLPHADSVQFQEATVRMREIHLHESGSLVELKDSQAAVCRAGTYEIVG